MSQYKTGTVQAFSGLTTITGTGTVWLTNVKQGDVIVIGTDQLFYIVASVNSDTQITLSSAYHTNKSGQNYVIVSDFSNFLRLLLPSSKDSAFPEMVRRNFLLIDQAINNGFRFMGEAEDKDLSAAPGSPSDGDTYIVAGTPVTGNAWFGQTNNIAIYSTTETAWNFTTSESGMLIYVKDENKWYSFTSVAWRELSIGITITGSTIHPFTFSDGDLASGILTITHNLGSMTIDSVIYKPTNKKVSINPEPIDGSSCRFDFSNYGTLEAGNWYGRITL